MGGAGELIFASEDGRGIRNSAKAVIIDGERILLTKNEDHLGIFYLLPGGGQRFGETLPEAVRRECREEIRADVEVGEVRFIREYIGKNHEFAATDNGVHQVEYMFACKVAAGEIPGTGPEPDGMQIGVEWVDLERLGEHRLYPDCLRKLLKNTSDRGGCLYLGDCN